MSTSEKQSEKKSEAKQIILGPDGKPCRSCNSLRDLMALGMGSKDKTPMGPMSSITKASRYIKECPPDVELLGRSTWTFLHTMAANYPAEPSPVEQSDMSSFIRTFSNFYPCWVCAEDLRIWMAHKENEPVVSKGWEGLGQWMCNAHNEVNMKLGKPAFNCKFWTERWKDGWKDGSCG